MDEKELTNSEKRNQLWHLARAISAATDEVNLRRRGVQIAETNLANATAALQEAMNTFDLRLQQYMPDTTEGES